MSSSPHLATVSSLPLLQTASPALAALPLVLLPAVTLHMFQRASKPLALVTLQTILLDRNALDRQFILLGKDCCFYSVS